MSFFFPTKIKQSRESVLQMPKNMSSSVIIDAMIFGNCGIHLLWSGHFWFFSKFWSSWALFCVQKTTLVWNAIVWSDCSHDDGWEPRSCVLFFLFKDCSDACWDSEKSSNVLSIIEVQYSEWQKIDVRVLALSELKLCKFSLLVPQALGQLAMLWMS